MVGVCRLRAHHASDALRACHLVASMPVRCHRHRRRCLLRAGRHSCCRRACSTRSRSAASSSALTLRAISLSPVSGALMFSRAAERGSRRDSARAMRRSSRAYRPQAAMIPKHAPVTTPQARASWVSTAASPFNPLRPACGAHTSCGDFYSDFLRATHTSTAALRSRVAPATMRTYIQAGILGTP